MLAVLWLSQHTSWLPQHSTWLSSLEKLTADSRSAFLPCFHVLCCRARTPVLVVLWRRDFSIPNSGLAIFLSLLTLLTFPLSPPSSLSDGGPQGPFEWLDLNLHNCSFQCLFLHKSCRTIPRIIATAVFADQYNICFTPDFWKAVASMLNCLLQQTEQLLHSWSPQAVSAPPRGSGNFFFNVSFCSSTFPSATSGLRPTSALQTSGMA